jgi:hypothetical protein
MPQGGAASRKILERFSIKNDPVGEFLKAYYIFDPHCAVDKNRFTQRVQEFCEANEMPYDDLQWFFKKLKDMYPLKDVQRSVDGTRVRYIQGLRLKPAQGAQACTVGGVQASPSEKDLKTQAAQGTQGS